MVYVDSSGVTHVSYEEGAHGYAATHTASRNAAGEVVGNDTGSRYVRQQEAEKAAEQQQQQQQQQNAIIPYYTPSPMAEYYNKATSPITAAPTIQQRTVSEASFIPSSLPEKATAFLSRSREAMKQGYEAGQGRVYSLAGLVAPENRNTLTNSLYEKSSNLADRYSNYRDSLLSGMSPGITKDIVMGVSDIPEMGIRAAGQIPYGLEAIGRNPTRISDSISFGIGEQVGSIVNEGETHPGRLAGQLIGSYGVGKLAGRSYAAVSPKEIRTITETTTERQFSLLEGIEKTQIDTLGSERNYFKIKTRAAGENELNPSDVATAKDFLNLDKRTFNVNYKTTRSLTDSNLNTEIKAAEGRGTVTLKRNNVIQAEQKTLFGDTIVKVDKSKWEADLSGINPNKLDFKKQYSIESYEGRENFEYDFATSVENSRIRVINEILPERAIKEGSLPANAKDYFDVPKTPKQSTLFDDFSGNSNIVIHTPGSQIPRKFYNSLKDLSSDERGELLPIVENKLLPVQELNSISGRPKAELDIWKRNVIFEELEPITRTATRSYSIPNTYSSYWGIDAAGFGVISSSLLTKVRDPLNTGPVTKNSVWGINVPKLEVNTAEKTNIDIISGNRLDIRQGIIPGINVIPDIRPDIIPDIRNDVIPDIRNDVIPSIIPDSIPDSIPDTIPDTIPDIVPDTVPEIGNTFIYIDNKSIFPIGGGDFNFKPFKEGYTPKRKTKNRKLKNKYGDPFKVGIKIKL